MNVTVQNFENYILLYTYTCLNLRILLHPGSVSTVSFSDFNNTLEFVTLAWDYEPGSNLIVHYTTKNVWFAKIFLYNLRHIGYSNIWSLQLFLPELYSTIQWSGFHVLAEGEIFYLCNIQTEYKIVRETTRFCCFFLLQGKNCWLYFKHKTISNSKLKSSIF